MCVCVVTPPQNQTFGTVMKAFAVDIHLLLHFIRKLLFWTREWEWQAVECWSFKVPGNLFFKYGMYFVQSETSLPPSWHSIRATGAWHSLEKCWGVTSQIGFWKGFPERITTCNISSSQSFWKGVRYRTWPTLESSICFFFNGSSYTECFDVWHVIINNLFFFWVNSKCECLNTKTPPDVNCNLWQHVKWWLVLTYIAFQISSTLLTWC